MTAFTPKSPDKRGIVTRTLIRYRIDSVFGQQYLQGQTADFQFIEGFISASFGVGVPAHKSLRFVLRRYRGQRFKLGADIFNPIFHGLVSLETVAGKESQ